MSYSSALARHNIDKWNSITIASVASENPSKSLYEVVQLMIITLTQLMHGLEPKLRVQEFLYGKIVSNCQESPACRYAVLDPPKGLGELINKIYSLIIAYEKEQKYDSTSFFTDRRFHSKSRDRRPGTRPTTSYRGRNSTRNSDKTCFICKKPDCRSWNHSTEEQEESKRCFRERNKDRFRISTPGFDKKFNKSYRQYLSLIEGDDDDDSDDPDALGDAFGALLVDSINDNDIEEIDSGAALFFTSI